MSLKFVCPKCGAELREVLDSDGGLFVCIAEVHGRVCPSYPREELEKLQYGDSSLAKLPPENESRPTPLALDEGDSSATKT